MKIRKHVIYLRFLLTIISFYAFLASSWQTVNASTKDLYLLNCLLQLYWGDHTQAIESYCYKHRPSDYFEKIKIIERYSKRAKYEKEFSIIEKDGYFYIKESLPKNMISVALALQETDKDLPVIQYFFYIPQEELEHANKIARQEGMQITKFGDVNFYSIRDPIYEFLKENSDYASRYLVEQIHKTVEYRRSKSKWFW